MKNLKRPNAAMRCKRMNPRAFLPLSHSKKEARLYAFHETVLASILKATDLRNPNSKTGGSGSFGFRLQFRKKLEKTRRPRSSAEIRTYKKLPTSKAHTPCTLELAQKTLRLGSGRAGVPRTMTLGQAQTVNACLGFRKRQTHAQCGQGVKRGRQLRGRSEHLLLA